METLQKALPVNLGAVNVRRLAAIFGVALLTALSAWIAIPLPFTPVPVTLQTAAVLAGAVLLGRDSIYSQLLYLGVGGIGLPVFAGMTGGLVLFGPTGGYLIGFVMVSALAAAWLAPSWKTLSYVGRLWRLVAASLLIFIPGVLQLKLTLGVNWTQAMALGFTPFLLGDLLKCALVAGIPTRFASRK